MAEGAPRTRAIGHSTASCGLLCKSSSNSRRPRGTQSAHIGRLFSYMCPLSIVLCASRPSPPHVDLPTYFSPDVCPCARPPSTAPSLTQPAPPNALPLNQRVNANERDVNPLACSAACAGRRVKQVPAPHALDRHRTLRHALRRPYLTEPTRRARAAFDRITHAKSRHPHSRETHRGAPIRASACAPQRRRHGLEAPRHGDVPDPAASFSGHPFSRARSGGRAFPRAGWCDPRLTRYRVHCYYARVGGGEATTGERTAFWQTSVECLQRLWACDVEEAEISWVFVAMRENERGGSGAGRD